MKLKKIFIVSLIIMMSFSIMNASSVEVTEPKRFDRAISQQRDLDREQMRKLVVRHLLTGIEQNNELAREQCVQALCTYMQNVPESNTRCLWMNPDSERCRRRGIVKSVAIEHELFAREAFGQNNDQLGQSLTLRAQVLRRALEHLAHSQQDGVQRGVQPIIAPPAHRGDHVTVSDDDGGETPDSSIAQVDRSTDSRRLQRIVQQTCDDSTNFV